MLYKYYVTALTIIMLKEGFSDMYKPLPLGRAGCSGDAWRRVGLGVSGGVKSGSMGWGSAVGGSLRCKP